MAMAASNWSVPRAWPGATVVCLGGGPSLTQEDVDRCRGRARVIAINDAYKLAPWADVLYACDGAWWTWHQGASSFQGLKVAGEASAGRWPGVRLLTIKGLHGLEHDSSKLCGGNLSGYQAINLAVHFGAAKILLLGYDMQLTNGRTHWFGDHPNRVTTPYRDFIDAFDSLVEPLATLGVEIVNCTTRTALTCFPCRPLDEVLS